MLTLAFDTTMARCAVALCADGAVLAEAIEDMEQGHAEALVPLIQRVMAQAGRALTDVDRFAVTVGPGSFTGVRVGLSTARAMGLAASKPVVGVTTTEAIAAGIAGTDAAPARILAAVDTRRGDLYVQMFDRAGAALTEPAVVAPEDLPRWTGEGPVVVAGDGAALARTVLDAAVVAAHPDAKPQPAVIARLAAMRAPDPREPLPLYLRPPEATLPKDGGRLRP